MWIVDSDCFKEFRYWNAKKHRDGEIEVENLRSGLTLFLEPCDLRDLEDKLDLVRFKTTPGEINTLESMEIVTFISRLIYKLRTDESKVFMHICSRDGYEFVSRSNLVFCDCGKICDRTEDISSSISEEAFDFLKTYEKKNIDKLKVAYRDGQKVLIEPRIKRKKSSEAQIKAAENARKYSHTPSANAKRKRSLVSRKYDIEVEKTKF